MSRNQPIYVKMSKELHSVLKVYAELQNRTIVSIVNEALAMTQGEELKKTAIMLGKPEVVTEIEELVNAS